MAIIVITPKYTIFNELPVHRTHSPLPEAWPPQNFLKLTFKEVLKTGDLVRGSGSTGLQDPLCTILNEQPNGS